MATATLCASVFIWCLIGFSIIHYYWLQFTCLTRRTPLLSPLPLSLPCMAIRNQYCGLVHPCSNCLCCPASGNALIAFHQQLPPNFATHQIPIASLNGIFNGQTSDLKKPFFRTVYSVWLCRSFAFAREYCQIGLLCSMQIEWNLQQGSLVWMILIGI